MVRRWKRVEKGRIRKRKGKGRRICLKENLAGGVDDMVIERGNWNKLSKVKELNDGCNHNQNIQCHSLFIILGK